MFSGQLDLAAAVPAERAAAGHRTACFCLHIGLPKTATTLLQTHLFPQHSQIDYLGKHAQTQHKSGAGARQLALKILSRTQASAARVRDPMGARLASAMSRGKVPLFSKEGYSGRPPGRQRKRAQAMRDLFGPCKVILTIREPLGFAESVYFQQLKSFQFARGDHQDLRRRLGPAPRYFDVNEWLGASWDSRQKNLANYLRYADTAETYADVFGKEQVGIFVFEELKASPDAFIRRLCEFIGIDPDEGQRLVAGKRVNTRWSPATIDRLKTIQGSLRGKLHFRLATRSQRKRMLGLDEAEAMPAGPPARAELSPAWRERILDLGRTQSQRLLARWDLPLARYGYPL